MSTAAIIALQQALKDAQSEYADVAADKRQAIEDGRRAQSAVDAAARRVEDYQRAINTLEAAERQDQVEVGDDQAV